MDIKNQNHVLGCDIGNGYAYVSLLTEENKDPIPLFASKHQLTGQGMPTASYIAPPDGSHIITFTNGKPAEVIYKSKPEQIVRAIKTRFKEGQISVPGIEKPVDAGKVYGAITRDLLTLAHEELRNRNMDPVNNIVFTFPAAFADETALLERMQRSIEAVSIDDKPVKVLGRLPEPAAVAIDYLHYMQHLAPEDIRIKKDSFTVLVYDLGHGTFDTAVVTANSKGTPYTLHSKAGLPEVGGKNFDDILVGEITRILREEYDFTPANERARDIIRTEAIRAKLALTKDSSYTVTILNGEEFCDVEITRERFEELSQHLLFQTLELVGNVLDDAASAGIKIDYIVLSGGASQMPMVRNGLQELLEDEYPIVLYRPSEAVSFGASRYAYQILEQQEKLSAQNTTDPKKTQDPAGKKTVSVTRPVPDSLIMDQLTDCCYGIWVPSKRSLEGEVQFIIQSGQKRPAVSQKVDIYSASQRLIIKIYRSKKKQLNMKTASLEECESILWVPFDVQPETRYEVTMTALENYGIEVELRSQTGEVQRKNTSDLLSRLI